MKQTNVLKIAVALVFMTYHTSTQAQTLTMDAELRSRSELRSGFKKPLSVDEHNAFVSALRSRLNLMYTDDKMEASLRLQDARTYGETGTSDTKSSLGLYESWAKYKFTPEFSATLGRQSLEYDDKRIFSASNWSNTGNSHDLLLLKYEAKNMKVHVGSAWNNADDVLAESAYSVSKSYKSLNYLWLEKPLGKIDLTALWVNDGFQRGTTPELLNKLSYRNTVGGNVLFSDKKQPLYVYASGYFQFGHNPSDKSLSAYLLALKTKYKITPVWTVTLGSDYLSGSKSDLEAGKDRTFNKLYGVSHSFNGSMEYWATLPAQGLLDLFGGITFAPNAKFDIDATYHNFSLAEKLATSDSKALGSEIDITANYKVSSQFSIQGGWSAYFKTDQTSIVKKQTSIDTRFAHWAYVMLTFKPKFLSYSK